MARLTACGTVLIALALTTTAALAQTAAQPAIRDVAAEIACGPQAAFVAPAPSAWIAASVNSGRELFGIGDGVVISGGTAQGIKPGEVYAIRRVVKDRFTTLVSGGLEATSIHTAGWLRVSEAQTNAAVGTVTQACDGIQVGDYLEPLVMPAVPTAAAAGEPDYSAPGHIILGDERRQMGGAGSFMVLDRGSDHGLKPGQRLTVYRETMGGKGPVRRIGDAVAFVVNAETALIRIVASNDAVAVGDFVALLR